MSIVPDERTISPAMAGTLMTAEEFDAADDWDEGYRYELLNGVLVVTPPAAIGERGSNDLLAHLLRTYQDQHPQGSALNYTVSEQTVRTKKNRRRADRVVWAGLGRPPHVKRDPPTIVVEFVSPGRRSRQRDYQTKRREYGEVKVREYWIIDRFQRQMTVVRYGRSRMKEIVVGEGDVYQTELLSGFELPISRLLAEADLVATFEGDD